jgi:hypothetical protein
MSAPRCQTRGRLALGAWDRSIRGRDRRHPNRRTFAEDAPAEERPYRIAGESGPPAGRPWCSSADPDHKPDHKRGNPRRTICESMRARRSTNAFGARCGVDSCEFSPGASAFPAAGRLVLLRQPKAFPVTQSFDPDGPDHDESLLHQHAPEQPHTLRTQLVTVQLREHAVEGGGQATQGDTRHNYCVLLAVTLSPSLGCAISGSSRSSR